MKNAIIVGAKGQDGRLLHENLEQKGYQVTGIVRLSPQSQQDDRCLALDISDANAVSELIRISAPDEIYYLAAFHHSSENLLYEESGELFAESFQVHVLSLINFLEAMRRFAPKARLFYAASSHVFGNPSREPQNEQTPFNPTGVYGITKSAGIHTCRFYRNCHKMYVASGILYNHESHYRNAAFVTKKIVQGAVNIQKGLQDRLFLGSLNAEVDWGYAPDYVEAFRMILDSAVPDDFIVATGKKHRVRDFVEITFGYLGLDWSKYVEENEHIIHKTGVTLVGDPEKLMYATGWKPSVDLRGMIRLLVQKQGGILYE